jgi:hypothetical protein
MLRLSKHESSSNTSPSQRERVRVREKSLTAISVLRRPPCPEALERPVLPAASASR